jgi:hypothetical protein
MVLNKKDPNHRQCSISVMDFITLNHFEINLSSFEHSLERIYFIKYKNKWQIIF